jgi:glycosyltransferase involved in cell wall biosynthesis
MEASRTEPKVSVYMITYNNEETVERALKSVTWTNEIVIVDSFSNDRTVEIGRKFTDKLFQRKWPGHRDQYQFAADLTTHEWIMFVDADEEISPELAAEIRQELNGKLEGVDGFFVYRRTFYLGRWIRYGGWYPDGEIRLYRRNKGKWEGGLHARVVIEGTVKSLKGKYLHYTYRNISDQIQTIDKYSTTAAKDLVLSTTSFSLIHLLLNPIFRFLRDYILKLGFLDGIPGLVIAVSTAYYAFIKYAKLWERYFSTKER